MLLKFVYILDHKIYSVFLNHIVSWYSYRKNKTSTQKSSILKCVAEVNAVKNIDVHYYE